MTFSNGDCFCCRTHAGTSIASYSTVDAACLDRAAPARNLARDELLEVFGRAAIGRGDLLAERLEAAASQQGRSSALLMAWLSWLTIGCGVSLPARNRPCQVSTSKSRTLLLGGRDVGQRRRALQIRWWRLRLTWPPSICGFEVDTESQMYCTRPAIRSCIAGPRPR